MRWFKCFKSKKKEKTDEEEVHGDVDEVPDKTVSHELTETSDDMQACAGDVSNDWTETTVDVQVCAGNVSNDLTETSDDMQACAGNVSNDLTEGSFKLSLTFLIDATIRMGTNFSPADLVKCILV